MAIKISTAREGLPSDCVCVLNRVQLCATSWTIAHRAPLSMGLSREEYWSGLSFPAPGDLPDQTLILLH